MSAAPLRPQGRAGLRFRVLLLVGVGVLLPTAIVSALALSRLWAQDERMMQGSQQGAAALAAHFDAAITEELEVLQRLASSLAMGSPERSAEQDPERLRRAFMGLRFVGGVFLLDEQGRLVLEEPQHPRSLAPPADLPELQQVLRTGRPQVSGLVQVGDTLHLYAMVSVVDWQGRVTGVVGGLVDPGLARHAALLRSAGGRSRGTTELVDRSGRVLASTERGRLFAAGPCPPTTGNLIATHQGFAGRCNDCHELGFQGQVLAFAPLASAPWGVAVVQAEADLLTATGVVPAGFAVFALGVLLLAGGYAWGVAWSITRPVEVLTVEAEKIAGGKLDDPIPDLGRDELGRLGRSLDRMRASLAEAMGQVARANAELEGRVEERTRELHQAYDKLQEREEQRARLLRTVITAQEDERKRIARELHDETTQSLAVLVMGLESALTALRSGGPVPRLDEVKALAVHILDEIHRLILDLRPSVLDDLGLFSAVRWYAERHLQARGVALRCEVGAAPRIRLPPEVEIAVFRICQEAINNITRHAKAESVLIQLEAEDRRLRIEIEDDGAGFDPAGPGKTDRRHYGLLGIRERAELLGGQATIDSAPGRGTRVEVVVPLPETGEPETRATPVPVAGDSAGPARDNRGGGST
ncbi:MAG: HAMP domain-containing protein [Deltaproteobacteria bacterium]|nr:HAMP domain-containing protein [Deltaproteobacteria bacterium]